MPRLLRQLVLALSAAVLAAGAQAAEITVSAASSLTNAFRELVLLFEAAHPGVKVHLNFAASGALLQQVAKGAPVDVLASADQATMDRAQAQGLVQAGSRRNFASNALVVIVPAQASRVPQRLADLEAAAYARVAIGLPASVPVGRYTQAVLEQAGLWAGIQPRMIGAGNVRQALDYVARGEVDAGFVYATDAALMPDRVRVAFTVPTSTPVHYPIAAVSPALPARQFVEFVVTAPAQAVLHKHGFGPP